MSKYIVITSIFPPTEAVRKFTEKEGWTVVVVGDKKTPSDWNHTGAVYLSPSDQKSLGFKLTDSLPWNHYCRKMVGYLYAASKGAQVIMDTDDDNIPLDDWLTYPFEGQYDIVGGAEFINIYKLFTNEFIWPRGFPLRNILDDPQITRRKKQAKVGVWQMLANGDPDVDAIYRLTNNKPVTFDKNHPVVLENNVFSPFNSQNTFFDHELFPLLYLPAFVTFRFTDILRGLVAQPVLWNAGYSLGVGPATVVQERNAHDYTKDFESEVPVYLHSEEVSKIASASIKSGASISDNLMYIYQNLHKAGIVVEEELGLLAAWLEDIRTVL